MIDRGECDSQKIQFIQNTDLHDFNDAVVFS